MISTHAPARFLALALFCATTTLASTRTGSAQTAAPAPVTSGAAAPIAITACDALKTNNQMGFGNVAFNGHAVYFFKVTFTDTGTVAADSVNFQIDNNADRFFITDAGTYAPGSPVTHTLRSSAKNARSVPRPGGAGPVACAVVSAHFTDGTTWTAAADPAASATH